MVLPRGDNVRHHNQPFGNTRAYPLGGVLLLRFVNIHLLHIIKNLTALPLFLFLTKILQNAPSFVSFFECFFAQHIQKNKLTLE